MTEHDRLRQEALFALRRAHLALRKLATDGTDVGPQRQAVREASELVGRIRRDEPGRPQGEGTEAAGRAPSSIACTVCGTRLTERELESIASDIDFVQCRGGDHLIRLVSTLGQRLG